MYAFYQNLINKYSAPLYVYRKDVIADQINAVKKNLQRFDLLFSIKCNPNSEILSLMSENGIGADCASKNEVIKSEAVGICGEDIYYSSPGKTRDDISAIIDKCVIIADSVNEIYLIDSLAASLNRSIEIGVRLNVSNERIQESRYEIMGGASSKFGIDLPEFLLRKDKILNECGNISVTGIHIYFGSQILDIGIVENNFSVIAETALLLLPLKFVNFGGGFGVPYSDSDIPLDIKTLGGILDKSEALRHLGEAGVKLNLELGRYLVAECGEYVTQIADIKESFGKKYLILNGGMNSFTRPIFTAQQHKLRLLSGGQTETVCVGGNMCTPIDQYFDNISLPKSKIGDIAVFENAGAYGYSMSMLDFISHDRPTEVLV